MSQLDSEKFQQALGNIKSLSLAVTTEGAFKAFTTISRANFMLDFQQVNVCALKRKLKVL